MSAVGTDETVLLPGGYQTSLAHSIARLNSCRSVVVRKKDRLADGSTIHQCRGPDNAPQPLRAPARDHQSHFRGHCPPPPDCRPSLSLTQAPRSHLWRSRASDRPVPVGSVSKKKWTSTFLCKTSPYARRREKGPLYTRTLSPAAALSGESGKPYREVMFRLPNGEDRSDLARWWKK